MCGLFENSKKIEKVAQIGFWKNSLYSLYLTPLLGNIAHTDCCSIKFVPDNPTLEFFLHVIPFAFPVPLQIKAHIFCWLKTKVCSPTVLIVCLALSFSRLLRLLLTDSSGTRCVDKSNFLGIHIKYLWVKITTQIYGFSCFVVDAISLLQTPIFDISSISLSLRISKASQL